MIWKSWSNGSPSSTGAGYGIRVPLGDRTAQFDPAWSTVTIELGHGKRRSVVNVNVAKPSFWDDCPELIHKDIGAGLLTTKRGSWRRGKPHPLKVGVVGKARFRVY